MPKKAPEKENSERWLLTYSDLMNLLLILFIILYSASKADAAKMAQVAQSLKEGFKGDLTASTSASASTSKTTSSSTSSGSTLPNYWTNQNTQYSQFLDDLVKLLKSKNLLSKVEITADNRGIVISLRDNVLFTPGSADLSTDANSLITGIGDLLKPLSFTQLIIEGHTDSDPLKHSVFKDNRDLSSERANNVARVMEACGLTPQKIASIGYGQYKPVAANTTAANKAKNRRVVITILRQELSAQNITTAESVVKSASSSKTSSSSSSSSTSSSSSH